MPHSPAPEMHAALKRHIIMLEDENAKLVSKMLKRPIHSYVREGQAIRRLVSLTDPVTDLIAEYDRRIVQVEDGNDIDLVESTERQECTFRSYKKLVQWCPSVMELTRGNVDADDLVSVCQELKRGADGARGDDTNTLKRSVAIWLNHQAPNPVPLIIIDEKQGRGLYHDITGRLICPVDYNWLDMGTYNAICTFHPNYPVMAHMWPTFLYSEGQYNPQRPSTGLFKGDLLLRAFRCIFTSPSSAREDPEDEDVGGQPNAGNKPCKLSRLPHTHCDVAGLLKMHSVQPCAIAYVAVQLRFALSSSTSWDIKDDNFDYNLFYNNILDWFERPRSQAKAQVIEELLLWWNCMVFGCQHTSTLQPQNIANSSVAVSME